MLPSQFSSHTSCLCFTKNRTLLHNHCSEIHNRAALKKITSKRVDLLVHVPQLPWKYHVHDGIEYITDKRYCQSLLFFIISTFLFYILYIFVFFTHTHTQTTHTLNFELAWSFLELSALASTVTFALFSPNFTAVLELLMWLEDVALPALGPWTVPTFPRTAVGAGKAGTPMLLLTWAAFGIPCFKNYQ